MKIIVICTILAVLVGIGSGGYVLATPSSEFFEVGDEVADEWGICRTRAFGEDGFYQLSEAGFRPVIVFEALGEHADLAYSQGKEIAQEYPNQMQRAETVFYFVRDRVKYTPDVDQFEHEEFAQNADELAAAIDEKGVGYGDCEDSAVLLAVIYRGAGFRSAIVVGEGHTAALVYLPEYKKATAVFTLDGEPGWVWAEATGKNNPLGWVPKEFINVRLAAYEITDEAIEPSGPVMAPSVAVTGADGKGGGFSFPFPFISVISLLWLISLFRRKRT